MNKQNSLKFLQQIDFDNINFADPILMKNILKNCLNLIELLFAENQALKIENQKLRDEINKLKGEKGKPNIKPNSRNNKNDKSNMEKKTKKQWSKSSKKNKIKIDREEKIKVDKGILPDDAEFKGYEKKIVQDIKIETDNVLYLLEKYYSPSQGKTYIAEVPIEHQGTEFGPELKAFCALLYYDCRVPENMITKLLQEQGIIISEGTISNILIKENKDILTQEKEAIFSAGQKSSNYQQIDDTGMRVNGKNCYATIVCNNEYSAYFINERKNRDTVKNILYNDKDYIDFEILVSDDAGQFHNVTEAQALCWIHEERHYKKLNPLLEHHKRLVENKRKQLWDYYDELGQYKLNPTEEMKQELDLKFDKIFGETVDYDDLNIRLRLTQSKKEELLMVLDHPEVPLHNNLSENGIRPVVIKRKISGGTRTEDGTIAWENYLSILGTCKKQGVSFFKYLKDIFSRKFEMTRLADLISK